MFCQRSANVIVCSAVGGGWSGVEHCLLFYFLCLGNKMLFHAKNMGIMPYVSPRRSFFGF